jgi:hypothetical protein
MWSAEGDALTKEVERYMKAMKGWYYGKWNYSRKVKRLF